MASSPDCPLRDRPISANDIASNSDSDCPLQNRLTSSNDMASNSDCPPQDCLTPAHDMVSNSDYPLQDRLISANDMTSSSDCPLQERLTSASGMSSNSACLLLGLPAELRNRIYELVIEEEAPDGHCVCSNEGQRSLCLPRHRYRRPAILSVCRQITHEANGIWLAQLKLYLDFKSEASEWIRTFTSKAFEATDSVILLGDIRVRADVEAAGLRWVGICKLLKALGIRLKDGVLKMRIHYKGQQVITGKPYEELKTIWSDLDAV